MLVEKIETIFREFTSDEFSDKFYNESAKSLAYEVELKVLRYRYVKQIFNANIGSVGFNDFFLRFAEPDMLDFIEFFRNNIVLRKYYRIDYNALRKKYIRETKDEITGREFNKLISEYIEILGFEYESKVFNGVRYYEVK